MKTPNNIRPQILTAISLALFWSSVSVGIAAEPEKLSESALQQIRALQQEKLSRSAQHRKLDSQFVFKLKQSRKQEIAPGVTKLQPDLQFEPDGRLLVDIDATVNESLLAQIKQSGGTVINSFPQFHAVRALVTLDQLESLADLAEVKFIRRAAQARANTGSYTSEGDATHRADAARSAFGVRGQGVKVGVLSDSIDYLSSSQASGDLGDVTVLPGQLGSGSGEGTAMLEIIHDLAAGAQLYFATAQYGPANFAQNILNLRSNGCDIIVDDVGYLNESPFQDGVIAQAVNAVTASGALYFSAAGNQGSLRNHTSGTWEGDFVDGGPAGPPVNAGGGRLLSFGATTYNTVLNFAYSVNLFWSDPLGASANDYDLFVLDSTGSYVVASSLNLQSGTQDPYETLSYVSSGNRIVVVKASGDPRFLHLEVLPQSLGSATLSFSTQGATRGHSAAATAFSVAAVSAITSYPNPFTGGNQNPVESFSSDGPRRVFFSADGTPITPGNFSSTGGAVRQKPDLAAADRVQTSLYYFRPFIGTSAAAPHAAAIAALLLSYNHNLSPSQIRNALTSTALDIESPGVDVNSGAGIVMADSALQALPPRPVVIASGSALVAESCPNGAVDSGEAVTVSFSLVNAGPADTTNLIATLQTTGGITAPSGPQSYGVLTAHGGTASKIFSFTGGGACGETNIATLRLQDGTNDLGTASFAFALGNPRVPLLENFDAVTPPALPPGWTSFTNGASAGWTSINGYNDTPPNSALVSVYGSSDSRLTSPLLPIVTAAAQVSFRHSISTYYYGYDGGVLEISIDGGAFTDIVVAGGSFVTNGYFATLYTGYGNPIQGRQAWTGYSGGYITTIANLPPTAAGKNVQLRWRYGASNYAYYGYWYLDTITVKDGRDCCVPVPNDLVISMSDLPDPVVVGDRVTYTIKVLNTGPSSATAVTLTDVLPDTFNLQSITVSPGGGPGYRANGGGTLSFSLGNLAGGSSAGVTIVGLADSVGSMTNRVLVGRAEADANTNNNAATTITTVFPPALSINDVTLFDGSSGLTNAIFTVSVWPPPFKSVTVEFNTADSTARAGTDYLSTHGTLVFAPGVTNRTISVPVIGTILNEPTRVFAVNLFNPVNASLGRSQGLGTILNDDALPILSVTDVTSVVPSTGTTNAVFNLSLNTPSGQTVSAYYYTLDGTAVGGVDYNPISSYVNFDPGQTNQTVTVTINPHVTHKPNQTFNLNINSPSNAKLSRDHGQATILTTLPGKVDHFVWDAISSPQSNGVPFAVALTAQDYWNTPASNFSSSVALSASTIGQTTNILGSPTHNNSANYGYYTFGYAFTPHTNLAVTHVRHYFGTKVSIWSDGGVLLASQYVNSVPGTWVETALATPLQLVAGTRYRVAAYTPYQTSFWRYDLPGVFPDGTIDQSYESYGDTFPNNYDSERWWFVDLRYAAASSIPISPTNSTTFTNGRWNGLVTVGQAATNVTLSADDGLGHIGQSVPFDVSPVPGQVTHFVWSPISSPQSSGVPFAVTVTAQDYLNSTASNFSGVVSLLAVGDQGGGVPTGSVVPYFTDNNESATGPEGPIIQAGFTPLHVYDISALNLNDYKMLFIDEYSNGYLSSSLLGRLAAIQAWVTNGGRLIVHDRSAGLNSPNPFLLGAAGSSTLRLETPYIDVIPPATNLVVAGPFGTIDNNTLDGGSSSAHGYVPQNQLPSSASAFLSIGGYPDQVVSFSYPLGSGQVYYSTIPLDCYLAGGGCEGLIISAPLKHIYTPNVLAYVSGIGSILPVPITPTNSGNFVNGVWSGTITVGQQATNVTLTANDGIGHVGQSLPFSVLPSPGQATSFVWGPIASPQSNGIPFSVNLTAKDYLNGPATNFTGKVVLSGSGLLGLFRTNTILGEPSPYYSGSGSLTLGYAFTPRTNITVSHLLHFFGIRVTIWTDSGVALTSRSFARTDGVWSETVLSPPLQLQAGQRYRVGVYTGGNFVNYWGTDLPASFPDGTIDGSYQSSNYSFPNNSDSARWWLVDLRYTVGVPQAVQVSPTNSDNFTAGVWNGSVAVLQMASNVTLTANDGLGHVSQSGLFNVLPTPGQVTHFAWGNISSPQSNGVPFAVTITAQDYLNNAATNFAGTVALTAAGAGPATNNIVGNLAGANSGSGDFTLAYAFTPNTNLVVTHVRHYSGTKVSIWKDDGTLLAAQPVISTPGTWLETPLASPLNLFAGVTYRVGYHTGTDPYFFTSNKPSSFPDGSLSNGYYYTYGDTFPTAYLTGNKLYLVDLRYALAFLTPVPLTPAYSDPFVNGVWNGNVTVAQGGSIVTLRAEDGLGHPGLSQAFDIARPPVVLSQPQPTTNFVGGTATFSVEADGSQPLAYQWIFNDSTPLPSATSASVTLTNLQLTDAGKYKVVVTNLFGSITSSNALLTVQSNPGPVSFDLNSDPSGLLTRFGSALWVPSGGGTNGAGGGYISLTDTYYGQHGAIVFNDLYPGLAIRSFRFSMDVRIGGGTTPPADGLSVNFARHGDSVLADGQGFVPAPDGTDPGAAEEGTRTGLSVMLDAYQNGGTDAIGIGVRVDGVILAQYPYPTLNGAANDTTSLQTGPDYYDLSWVPLVITLYEDGILEIYYKGARVTPLGGLQTHFNPGPGQFVLGARTGNAYEVHHVDNISFAVNIPGSPSTTLDHFTLSQIASPQFTNVPFQVTIQAQNATNGVLSNFTGTVSLRAITNFGGAGYLANFESGLQGFSIDNSFVNGNGLWHLSGGHGSQAGHSATGSIYYGFGEGPGGGGSYNTTNVSGYPIANEGVITSPLIDLRSVTNPPTLSFNYLIQTEADADWDQATVEISNVSSNGGYAFDVVAGNKQGNVRFTNDSAGTWRSASINLSNYVGSQILVRFHFNTVDSYANDYEGWYVDDVLINAPFAGSIAVFPVNSGNFTNGIWSGNLAVVQGASNVVLQADDGNGHTGLSSLFSVLAVSLVNDLSLKFSPVPGPISAGSNLTYTITVSNAGPAAANSVVVTDQLPTSFQFGSALLSQGSYSQTGVVVRASIGTVPGASTATVTIVGIPTIAGTILTNSAAVSRAEVDPYLGNNSAVVTTIVGAPAISIADATVLINNNGLTNILFPIALSAPSAQQVGVSYTTLDGTAVGGVDYASIATTPLTFNPGHASYVLSVVINPHVTVKPSQSFYVKLSNPANASLARTQALGTIITAVPGFADHFVWSGIASPQQVNGPFAVTLAVQDYLNSPATNYTGPANLSASLAVATVTNILGTPSQSTSVNSGNWTFGYAFTPNATLNVTHVRHYFGTKVSIWTDSGVLVASQNVTSVPGTWVETPLAAPIQLSASTRYRVAAYSGGGSYYWRNDLAGTFAFGTIDQGYGYPGDGFPNGANLTMWVYVDLRYSESAMVAAPISPTASGNFAGGYWSGNIAVLQTATNVSLRADDGSGHYGQSLSFDVGSAAPPPVTISVQYSGSQLQLSWPGGILQSANQATGQYSDIIAATSPYSVSPTAPQRFFRVRVR